MALCPTPGAAMTTDGSMVMGGNSVAPLRLAISSVIWYPAKSERSWAEDSNAQTVVKIRK